MWTDATQELAALTASLGHTFKSFEHLTAALTHPSLSSRGRAKGAKNYQYERLEFLGDRVVGLVIAEWLLERFPREKEGDIAKRHAALVRRETLDKVAASINLLDFIRMADGGKGDRENKNVLSDCCEAVIGALFLDGGLDAARRFIHAQWEPYVAQDSEPPMDPKTQLQEWLLARGMPLPVYETVSSAGPAHAPVFEIKVSVTNGPSAAAKGPSKRDAEKIAAEKLFNILSAS